MFASIVNSAGCNEHNLVAYHVLNSLYDVFPQITGVKKDQSQKQTGF